MSGKVLPFDRDRPKERGRAHEGGGASESQSALSELPDAAVRQRIVEELDESLLVEAAAGTGKTTVLVERIANVLAQGKGSVERIVAVTFTRKAAGELKLRLRAELDRQRSKVASDDERKRLVDAIARLEEARIGTIHSFCAELLRERPVEAHIDPGFVEVSDDEGPRLYRAAFERFMQERLQDLPEGLRRALVRLALDGRFDQSPMERLLDAGWALAEWRDHPASWARPEYDRQGMIDALAERVARLAALSHRCPNARDPLRVGLQSVELLATWIERSERAAGSRDYDSLEARLVELRKSLARNARRKGWGKFAEALPREQVVAERDALNEALAEFERLANADLSARLHDELAEATARYEALKQAVGKLDFHDLLVRTRALLRDQPAVRAYLQGRISHLFVDEFQDTDTLQTEILLLLSADDPEQSDWRLVRPVRGKLFLVGDPKQSIYRFRRADVQLYEQVKASLADRGVTVLEMAASFRAVPDIQSFVNRAFASRMDGRAEDGVPRYIALRRGRGSETVADGQPAIVGLPVPRPYGTRNVAGYAIERSLPEAVAAWIDWLLRESRWQVWDPEQRSVVPVAARHVCVLFRRYISWGRDVTRAYVRALEQRGIPHLLIGARTFHRREEVETVRAALVALEWPDDELAVYATLRGSLFAFPDDVLLRFSALAGFHPLAWRRRAQAVSGEGMAGSGTPSEGTPDELLAVGEALDVLARLHRRRNQRPIVETVRELFDHTRAWAGFAFRPSGNQVLANVEKVLDLARSYELGGGLSFRGFVEQLNEEAEKPASSQAPVVEEGADGVRLMTVHNAKGLEFPVVVLADMSARLASRDPDRTVDHERGLAAGRVLGFSPLELLERADAERRRDAAEGVRVAYVAATRARDLLVVPVVGDEPYNGWLEPLNRALYPAAEKRRRPAREGSLGDLGVPALGERSILERPVEREIGAEFSVRPGLHRFATDPASSAAQGSAPEGSASGASAEEASESGYHVLWWDPAALELSAEQRFGLRQEELLAADEDGAAERVRHLCAAWRGRQDQALGSGAHPSERVVVVTELEEAPPGGLRTITMAAAHGVDAPGAAQRRQRPSGRRFGDLVHSVLRHVGLHADAPAVEPVAQLQGRILRASAEEIAAAQNAVLAALASPIVARARSADQVLRESPFHLRLADGRLVEGTLDLAYRLEGSWQVVDFKTDLALEGREEAYRRQLSWYLEAVETLSGEAAHGTLLMV